MYCRWCGMESKTADVCEWCKKSLTAPPSSPPADAVPSAPPPAAGAPLPLAQTLPPTALTPQMVQAQVEQGKVPWGERWERFLAIATPLLVASVLLTHLVADAFLWVAFADFFILGVAMGATRAIEPYEEAFTDCFAVLVASYLLGPVVGLGIYLLVGLLKQEWNAAIVLLLVVHLVVRLVLTLAFATDADALSLIPQWSIIPGASFFAVVCSFGGWMMSSFFRPLNQ